MSLFVQDRARSGQRQPCWANPWCYAALAAAPEGPLLTLSPHSRRTKPALSVLPAILSVLVPSSGDSSGFPMLTPPRQYFWHRAE